MIFTSLENENFYLSDVTMLQQIDLWFKTRIRLETEIGLKVDQLKQRSLKREISFLFLINSNFNL